MERFAKLIVARSRWFVTAIVGMTIIALGFATRIDFEDRPRDVFRRDNDEWRQLEQMYEDFGADDNSLVIVFEGSDVLSPAAIATLRTIDQRLRRLDGISMIHSVIDIRRAGLLPVPLWPRTMDDDAAWQRARRRALIHPLVAGRIVSDDVHTTIMSVHLKGDSLATAYLSERQAQIRQIVDDAVAGTDLSVRLTGTIPIRVDSLGTLKFELIRLNVLGTAIALTIAGWIFRRAAFIVLIGPLIGVIWTLGMMGLLGLKLDGISLIVPTLLYIIGFTDAVHLLLDIQGSLVLGRSRTEAVIAAVRELGPACVLTSLTTSVGFGSLLVARTESIQQFGMTCGIGAGLLLIAVLVVLPLMALTRWSDSLRPAPDSANTSENPHDPPAPIAPTHDSKLARLLLPTLRFPRTVVATCLAICVFCAWSLQWMYADVHWGEACRIDGETRMAFSHLDTTFGGTVPLTVVLQWPTTKSLDDPEVLDVLREVHDIFRHVDHHGPPLSVLTVLESLKPRGGQTADAISRLNQAPPEQLDHILRSDLHRTRIMIPFPDIGAAASGTIYQQVQESLDRLSATHPGFHFVLTGTTVVAARNLTLMINDLAQSLMLASIVVFAVMTLALRSLRLGLISVVPNTLPLLVTAAALVWSGHPLRLTSVITFCVSLGIAVDDTIHLLLRFRREQNAGCTVRQATERSLHAVATALAITTVIFSAGTMPMLSSPIPPIREFAGLFLLTMVAALVGDLVFLPAMLLINAESALPDESAADDTT